MDKPIAYGALVLLILMLCYIDPLLICAAKDTILVSQVVSVGQTIISAGQIFELGFFSPGNSSRSYIGIWYKNISPKTIVWVANRESPLAVIDNSACLTLASDGNLRLLDGKQSTVWSTNISARLNGSFATLSDAGDLILRDSMSGGILWESFGYPCDVFMDESMMLGLNTITGQKRFLTSWRSEDDPAPGNFTLGLLPQTPVQAFVWRGSAIYWRSGPWNGLRFVGILGLKSPEDTYVDNLSIQQNNEEGTLYLTYNHYDNSSANIIRISPSGSLKFMSWQYNKQQNITWEAPASLCDVYGTCGQFGVCNAYESPICDCLKGFVPKSSEDWRKGNWSGGCVRQTELLCEKNVTGNLTSGRGGSDGFWKLSTMKLPDIYQYLKNEDAQGCQNWCLSNCSCTAYAYVSGINCLVWAGELIDIQQFIVSGEDLYIKLAHSELIVKKKDRTELIVSLTTALIVIISIIPITYAMCKLKAKRREKEVEKQTTHSGSHLFGHRKSEVKLDELPVFKLEKLVVATNNFDESNKLGQGGFGPVYKGKLEDGQEIAVKRLSRTSGQGLEEFMNEVVVISKLQHRNLVRLLGCCAERDEKMLIYEYMPNKSLDAFLCDPSRRNILNWEKRFNIIEGICRGILYLHRDSRLRIIHRDLKVSNILLDEDLNPKISDFGMARIFGGNQDHDNTRRVVGTYGYMSPEYAMRGQFSEKSDVFSFGVLLLEIINGKRNSSFWIDGESLSLLGYGWKLWNEGNMISFVDPNILSPCSLEQILRCLQVGLLCVQELPRDRPNISTVVSMVGGEIANLSQPKQPGFTCQDIPSESGSSEDGQQRGSINFVSITSLGGR
ncbi:hypothetical protein Ancab_040009 [Ancistrocladus abbreviatus]